MKEIPSLSKPTSEEQIALNGFTDDHLVKKEFTPAKWEDETKVYMTYNTLWRKYRNGWKETNLN